MQHNIGQKKSNSHHECQAPFPIQDNQTETPISTFLSESDSEPSKERQYDIMQLEQPQRKQSGHPSSEVEMQSNKSSAYILVRKESDDQYQRVDLDSNQPPHCDQFLIQYDSGHENSSSHQIQPIYEKLPIEEPQINTKSLEAYVVQQKQTACEIKAQALMQSEKVVLTPSQKTLNQKIETEMPLKELEQPIVNQEQATNKKMPSQPLNLNIQKNKNIISSIDKPRLNISKLFGLGLLIVIIILIVGRLDLSAVVSKLKASIQILAFLMLGTVLLCLIFLEKNMGRKARAQIEKQDIKWHGQTKSRC